jgi:hypothetical protein
VQDNSRTSIRVRQKTKLRLDRHGRKNQSYDELLNELMDKIEYPDDPITPGQIKLLEERFGVEIPPGMTKNCASFAISTAIRVKNQAVSTAIAARKQLKPLTDVEK